jgi:hypothetical protein
MPPKGAKRQSASEQIARLQQRAMKLGVKANIEWFHQVFKLRPELVASVVDHLVALGVPRPEEATSVGGRSSSGSVSLPRGGSVQSLGSTLSVCSEEGERPESPPEGEAEDMDDSKVPVDPVPRKYQSFERLPQHYILKFLAWMEPVACSGRALAGLAPGKGKKLPKAELDKLFVYMTDIEMGSKILPDQRSHSAMQAFLVAKNADAGRRMRDVVVPVDWTVHGHYSIEVCADGVWVCHRFTKLRAKCEELTGEVPEAVLIEHNWSRESAVITMENSGFRLVCATLLAACCKTWRRGDQAGNRGQGSQFRRAWRTSSLT